MAKIPYNPSTFLGGDDTVLRIQRKYADRFAPGARVLDLGCGEGLFLDLLRQRGVHGLGVDAFSPAVDACRRKGLDVRRADLFQYLRTCRQTFDGVFCSHIVEHLTPDQTQRLLQEANRVLKDRGLLIILTPNSKDIEVITERFWLDTTHVRPYPLKLLQAMFEHTGFEIVESGLDRDSARRLPKRKPMETLAFLIQKLRWGRYFGLGDTYIVGRKMAGLKGPRFSRRRKSVD
jgi:SAM-dependent methyltransferase